MRYTTQAVCDQFLPDVGGRLPLGYGQGDGFSSDGTVTPENTGDHEGDIDGSFISAGGQ